MVSESATKAKTKKSFMAPESKKVMPAKDIFRNSDHCADSKAEIRLDSKVRS